MIIKPTLRNNIFLNAHPAGCEHYVKDLFEEAKQLPNFNGPKRVLIIGGSSGYGLSSRVTLAQNAQASTINVSYESRPKDQRTGTAGYWNNVAFLKHTQSLDTKHYDIIGNAFSKQTKAITIQKIKETFGQIDLLVYSLASGARPNPETGEVIYSAIKPIGEDLFGKTVDIASRETRDIHIKAATPQEVQSTIYVMGGEDWQAWVEALEEASCIAPQFKTISYSYVGSEAMDKIYRSGTIGKAKDHLEDTALIMNAWLKDRYQGEAVISSSKAVTTKASVFIPGFVSYISCLFEVMKELGNHESILAHKHRLFKDMVYGDKRITDSKNRIRVDHYEMEPRVQELTKRYLQHYQNESIFELSGTQLFLKEVHHNNGFSYEDIDYEQEVSIESLVPKLDNLLDYNE